MRTLIAVLAVASALTAPAAQAKSGPGGQPLDYKVLLAPPAPRSLAAGHSWNVRVLLFLRNGKRWNISGLKPSLVLFNLATGRTRTVTLTESVGPSYRGRVVFPNAGPWNVVFDPGTPGLPGKRVGSFTVRSAG
jgi:hypothetical protein